MLPLSLISAPIETWLQGLYFEEKLSRYRLAMMVDLDVAASEVQSEVDVEEPGLRGLLSFPYLKGKRTRCYNIRRSTTRK